MSSFMSTASSDIPYETFPSIQLLFLPKFRHMYLSRCSLGFTALLSYEHKTHVHNFLLKPVPVSGVLISETDTTTAEELKSSI